MKFRASFQIPQRPHFDTAKDGERPGTSRHFKMPSLLHRPSRVDLANGNVDGNGNALKPEESKVNLPNATTSATLHQKESFSAQKGVPNEQKDVSNEDMSGINGTALNGTTPNGIDAPKNAKNTPTRKAMQGFLQKTGANLKATGAKLEKRIPRRTKSKVVKPSSKRNSGVQVRTFDLDSKTLDRMTAEPKERKATAGFLEKQRNRASARQGSQAISMMSAPHQAERDRRPLSANEIEAMFLGAPYFNVIESKGKYKPQVTFQGGDTRGVSKFPADYEALGHSSFASSTLYRQRSHDGAGRPLLARTKSNDTQASIKQDNGLRELPNMLSAHGLDPGAIGYEHFLQIPVADTTVCKQEQTTLDKRKQLKLDPEWLGLRDVDMDHMIHRLNELGEIHTGIKEEQWECPAPFSGGKVEEMGEELFEKLLSAELGTTGAGTGSVTLKTQISALQRVLNTTSLWHDFSLVEWRIRVGQLLWSETEVSHLDDERLHSERDVLILQITLAAELLIRLHALEALSSSFPPVVSQQDADALESQRTAKIQWDLLLAERFLENISIAPKTPSESEKKANRASFFSAITFFTARETEDELEESTQPVLTPKNEAEQLAGLVHFAESIAWPHASDVKTDLERKLYKPAEGKRISTAASIYATPLSSPKFSSTPGARTSFFGFSEKQRPGFSRSATAQSVQLSPARNIAGNIESFEVGGWLSRSWLSGLVMPGEAASHFLISTLLENSPQAITSLGEEASLYSGFVYEGRSYWSKASVVGRVLAASAGVKECMGWLSVPETQLDEDGWIEVAIKEVATPATKPRIKTPDRVAYDSSPLHQHLVSTIQAGDFIKLTDGPPVMGNEITYNGLSFNASTSSSNSETTVTADTAASTACLTFSSPINSRLDKMTIPLTYDVQFISSYPCHPRTTKPRSGSRPMTPSLPHALQTRDSSPSTPKSSSNTTKTKTPTDSKHPSKGGSTSTLNFSVFEKELPTTPAHPLHIDYQYDIIPVANLLSTTPESRPRALSSPKERKMSTATTTSNTSEDVVILDCRGTEDLELFARAFCARSGENALIGKSGRTCLACCVREARALGISVVIRT